MARKAEAAAVGAEAALAAARQIPCHGSSVQLSVRPSTQVRHLQAIGVQAHRGTAAVGRIGEASAEEEILEVVEQVEIGNL